MSTNVLPQMGVVIMIVATQLEPTIVDVGQDSN